MKNNDSRELFRPGSIAPPADAPILIADGLRTPENVGALIRLAANVGCKTVCLVGAGDMKESKIRKTACMAWDYVTLQRVDDAETLKLAIPDGYDFVAIETTPDAKSLYAEPLPRRVALVVGSEVHGIFDDSLAEVHSLPALTQVSVDEILVYEPLYHPGQEARHKPRPPPQPLAHDSVYVYLCDFAVLLCH